jgi:hypothetical protein
MHETKVTAICNFHFQPASEVLRGKRIKILSKKIWKPRNYNRKVRKIFKQNEYKKGNKEKKKQTGAIDL